MNPSLLQSETFVITALVKGLKYRRIHHLDEWRLVLFFPYSQTLIALVRTLPVRKYSDTLKCWYLPDNEQSLKALISAGLIAGPDEIRPTGTGQTEPMGETSDKTGITSINDVNPLPEGEKDSGNHQAGIQLTEKSKLESIVFQGSRFIIRLPYDVDEVHFIKTLDAAYWHPKDRQWLCKGSADNLRKLQSRYRYWALDKIAEIEALITTTNRRAGAMTNT